MEDKRVSDLTLKVLIEHYSKWGDTTEIEQSTTDALLELKQLRAELAAAKKTIEARDNECRDEHYTALCECAAELARLRLEREIEIENLSDPERKLKAWIVAARELALKCGMPEDEERTTRYLGFVESELKQLRERGEELTAALHSLMDGVMNLPPLAATACVLVAEYKISRAALDRWRNAKPGEGKG